MTKLDEQELFEILSHPTRRTILRALSQGYYISYSDLQEILGQSPGVIYHHIEKLRDQGILQQRSTKEYELTPAGLKIVTYMDKIKEEDLFTLLTQSKVHRIFLRAPVAKIVQNNPLHWTLEVGLIIIITSLIQINFPIQIIGPFLIPSLEPFLIRFLFQILTYIVWIAFIEFLAYLFAKSSPRTRRLTMISGLLVLPLLSSIFSSILWVTSLVLTSVPNALYWVLTLLLYVCYSYLLIHLLMTIRKISFEHSIIITLLQGYLYLGLVFFLV